MTLPFQHTLLHSISCVGVGLHSGNMITMELHPAPMDVGIVFRRSDVKGKAALVAANYMNVSNTQLGTTISNEHGVSVSTVEHLMAAFWGCGVDNAIVEVDGPEVPIMDGSSEPFVFLIECAGIKKQAKHRRIIEVLKKVEVTEDNKRVSILPAHHFAVSLEIDFNDKIVAHQTCVFDSGDVSFKTDLCRARTFCFENEVDAMRSKGLALGGSLDNAIVVGKEGVVNEGGLRYRDEFVRHKVLDCIGDFNLTGGMYLQGHLHGFRSGHALNNKLLRAFFADTSAWRLIETPVELSISSVSGHA